MIYLTSIYRWGAWGPWSMASKTCGEEHFIKRRERSCLKSGETVMECLQDDLYFPTQNSSGLELLDRNVEMSLMPSVKCKPTLVGNDEDPALAQGGSEFTDNQDDGGIPSLITEYSDEYLI